MTELRASTAKELLEKSKIEWLPDVALAGALTNGRRFRWPRPASALARERGKTKTACDYGWELKRTGPVAEGISKLKNMLSAVTIWPSGQ